MKLTITANTDQIRYWAQSALHGFEDLKEADVVANAQSDLQSILRYCDKVDGSWASSGLFQTGEPLVPLGRRAKRGE